MNEAKQAHLLYMRAVIDSRRNPDHLTPERLFAAVQTIHADISFEQWLQKMSVAAGQSQEQEQETELTPEQQAEKNEVAIQDLVKNQPENVTMKVVPI